MSLLRKRVRTALEIAFWLWVLAMLAVYGYWWIAYTLPTAIITGFVLMCFAAYVALDEFERWLRIPDED